MAELAALRAQLERAEAADNGAPAARRRHVDAAMALVIALVDDLEESEADDVLAMMIPLVTHDARLEIETRRRLAHELSKIRAADRATAQLEAAYQRARDFGLRELEHELAIALGVATLESVDVVIERASSLSEAAERVSDPELASKMERALAMQASGAEAIEHARKSLAHAEETVDSQTVADATSFLCELLVDAGELAEAKQLLEDRPPTRDGRADRALYDEIRRRQGEVLAEPPAEPDELAQPLPAIRTYFTKPHNIAQAIVDGALPSTAELREVAAGTIHTAADLESEKIFGPIRSFWCTCTRFRGREYSGMTCHRCGVELIANASRRTRVGLILLDAPIVHPWFQAVAPALLESPPTAIDELRDQLAAVDLDALAQKLKTDVISAPKAKIADAAGRRLAIVDALRKRPSSIVIDALLVPPPLGDLGFDRMRATAAYTALLDGTGTAAAVFAALTR